MSQRKAPGHHDAGLQLLVAALACTAFALTSTASAEPVSFDATEGEASRQLPSEEPTAGDSPSDEPHDPIVSDDHSVTAIRDPLVALQEGNRLFRDGRLEAAADAYLEGWDTDAPHPTLAYNLGTTLHHLDRLPEAVLWYRRAGDLDDPWLSDNLQLARRVLGSQSLPPGGPFGFLTPFRPLLKGAAIALAWLALALALWTGRRGPARWPAAAALLALATFSGALAIDRWGPKNLILLQDCELEGVSLPAGSEAWGRPNGDGSWRIEGLSSKLHCSADQVAPLIP